MIVLKQSEDIKFWTIAGITIISTHLWSFQLISESFYKLLEFAAILLILLIVLFNSRVFTRRSLKFKVFTLLFLFIPFLSMINANIFHDQSFGISFLTTRVNLLWLLYFALHVYNVPVERIIKLLIFIGCVWAFLTIIQQFTYPHYYFFTREDSDRKSIYRAGVYRYMVMGAQYGIFVLFYFFYKYTTEKQIKSLLFVCFMLAGLYFFGTRQTLVAAGACLFICILYLKGISKWKYLSLFTIGLIFVILFSSSLFGELVEMTSSQLDDEDYVRFLAADFFLNEYWPHWSAKLLGNGRPHALSSYGFEMEMIREMGFYRSDVGIIGTYNEYGIFYVINIICLFFTGVFLKMKNKKHLYLKLVFFFFAALLMLSIDFTHTSAIPYYCLVFYIIDKTYQMDDSKLHITKRKANVEKDENVQIRQLA